jgi:hypothetical protein
VGSAVTIAPAFSGNKQTVQVCPSDDGSGNTTSCTDQTGASNFVYLRTGPSATAPPFADPAIHPDASAAGTREISDWGDTAEAGQQFVVAGQSGDWTAIWYSGHKVWFDNPGGIDTRPAPGAKVLRSAGSAAVPVFGEGYPQPSEYPAGLTPSSQQPLSAYAWPAGQAYVATAPPMRAHRTRWGRIRPMRQPVRRGGFGTCSSCLRGNWHACSVRWARGGHLSPSDVVGR